LSAAHYIITYLSPSEELDLVQKKLWSDIHANIFTIYVALTKGQQSAFKQFLCGGNDKIIIADKFLVSQLKCFHLFHCFNEASDKIMCEYIEGATIFNEKEINLHYIKLSTGVIENLCLFLTYKQWEVVKLPYCYIQDHGLHIIHKYLNSSDITITQLRLDDNSLTQKSSSFISNIVLSCKVKRVVISGNPTIGDNEELYTMLSSVPRYELCLQLGMLY